MVLDRLRVVVRMFLILLAVAAAPRTRCSAEVTIVPGGIDIFDFGAPENRQAAPVLLWIPLSNFRM